MERQKWGKKGTFFIFHFLYLFNRLQFICVRCAKLSLSVTTIIIVINSVSDVLYVGKKFFFFCQKVEAERELKLDRKVFSFMRWHVALSFKRRINRWNWRKGVKKEFSSSFLNRFETQIEELTGLWQILLSHHYHRNFVLVPILVSLKTNLCHLTFLTFQNFFLSLLFSARSFCYCCVVKMKEN